MRKTIVLLLTMCCLHWQLGLSQNVQITGKVTSKEDGMPVPGVSIVVKGTTSGTITDGDGNYSLAVAQDASALVYSFVGMKTKEVEIAGRTVIDVQMEPELLKMDEVVVTALGIKRERKALGYSVSEVGSEDLVKARETNVVNAMAGKVAGVQITSSSGQAGSSARIVIRGNSSINYENQPLFVIDGVPFENSESTIKSSLSYGGTGNTGIDIDPNNIESMTVLKGASASALYGSRAANGVVLITTKSGKKGESLSVTVSNTTSIDKIIETPLQDTWAQGEYEIGDEQTTLTYIDGETEKTSWSWGPRIDDTPEAKRYDRWDTFQTGVTNETNVSIRGGGKKGSYFASYSDLNQKGTLDPIEFKRKNMLAKFSIDLTDRLKVTTSVNYIRSESFRLMEGNNTASFMNTFLGYPLTYNMDPAVDEFGNQRVYRSGGRNNYLWLMDNSGNPTVRDRFVNTLGLEYNFTEKLRLTAKVGQDFFKNYEEFYVNKGATGGHASGTFNHYNRTFSNVNSDIMLHYDTKLGSDFDANFMIGNNITSTKTNSNGVDGKGFVVPGKYNINNCESQIPWNNIWEKRTYSYYGQATFSFRSMLYYTFSGRMDGSSTLPEKDNSFFYQSHSLGFVFTELIGKNNLFNYGKVRASYAEVGNDAPAYRTSTIYYTPQPYDPYRGYVQYPFGGVGSFMESGLRHNENLKNELTKEVELGLELKFFNNRLGLDMAYYNKKSLDQIIEAPLDNSTGYGSAILNVGEMTNSGVELMIYATPVKTKDFTWDITLNWSKNKNKVNKIGRGVTSIQLNGFTGEGPYIVEGEPYGVIWGYSHVRDEQGRKVVNDKTGDWLVDWTNPGVVGDVNPDWLGGVRNTFTYKNFTVSAFLDIKKGGDVFNLDEHYLMYYGMSTLTEDRPDDMLITLDGPAGHLDTDGGLVVTAESNEQSTDYGALHRDVVSNITEDMTQDASFIKLREVSLAYSLPSRFLDRLPYLKGLDISLTGRNLWWKSDDSFTGADPEGSLSGSGNGQGIVNYMMPSTRTYTLGVKLSF